MARAISCSPRITTLAPCFLRCSTSASECARAMMLSSRVQRAGLLHHLAAFEGVGDGDEQAACGAEVGGGDDLGVRGIAGDGLDALRLQLGKPLIVALDDEERHLLLGKVFADDAADPAVADQHDMIRERGRADRLAGGAFLLRGCDRFRLGCAAFSRHA